MSNKREKAGTATVPGIQEEELVQRQMDAERNALFPSEGPIDELKLQQQSDEMSPGLHGVDEVDAEGVAFEIPDGQYAAGEVFKAKPLDNDDQIHIKMDAHIVDLNIREQIAFLGMQLRDELLSIAATRDNGISARMVGGAFDCPECGLRLSSPSLTSQTGGLYEHPWNESQKIGNKQCRLKGMKFRAPTVFLEAMKPMPLTDGKQ